MQKNNQKTEHHGASAQVHRNSSEYGDGGNIQYQLGNDDYVRTENDYDRNFVEDAFSEGTGTPDEEIGKVAFGNNLEEEKEAEDFSLSEDEMIDEEIIESFPASDPPGHRSKSVIDKELHPGS